MRVFNSLTGVLILSVTTMLISSCGSQKLMQGQRQMKSQFQAGNFERASFIADSLKENQIYQAKDRVLFALEKGTINYFQGEYDESIQSFTNAEDYIEQLFTNSAKRGVKAFLTNDTELAYNGEVYEDVYLNGFKSLSYLKLNEYESALVEARRIVQKLEQAEAKYSGLAESLSKADTTEKEVEWKAGTSNIHDSPLSHYIAGALYAKSGESDGARIEMQNLKTAIKNHQALPDSRIEFTPAFNKIDDPGSYNTMLTAFSGSAPDKVSNNIKIPSTDEYAGLKIAIPKLVMDSSHVHYVEAAINDTMTTRLPIIEEMDKVARETFQIKRPIIIARATIRGILKTASQQAITDAAEDEGGDEVGDVVNFLGGAIREASEKADLRGWQTMPGKVYTNVVKLPPGEHTIAFKYYSADEKLLYTQERSIEMTEQERLEPVASIYSN